MGIDIIILVVDVGYFKHWEALISYAMRILEKLLHPNQSAFSGKADVSSYISFMYMYP